MSPEPADIACSLDGGEQASRVGAWSALVAQRVGRAWDGDTLRLSFAADASLAAEVARLAVLEQQCCPFFAFTVTVTAGTLTLDVDAPPDARPIVRDLFGS
ncbi:MAG: hypothetical protein QOF18_1227 [Frankiaceae bacterium]|jgi:hypothetical protein|nr:hypothetical protein [Frankiaceae bacterium]